MAHAAYCNWNKPVAAPVWMQVSVESLQREDFHMHSSTGYTRTAIVLHWLMAAVIAAMLALGWTMTFIEDEGGDSAQLFMAHMSIGLFAAALLVWRIVWRLGHRPPALPATMPRWQRLAAGAIHGIVYGAMVVMPLSGFLGASLTRDGVVFLGLPLPRFVAADHDAAELLFTIHGAAAIVLVAAIGLHTLAALKHLWIDKDEVFERMWPRRRAA